jgi:hypothetical protein
MKVERIAPVRGEIAGPSVAAQDRIGDIPVWCREAREGTSMIRPNVVRCLPLLVALTLAGWYVIAGDLNPDGSSEPFNP